MTLRFPAGQTIRFAGKTGPDRARRCVSESRGRAELIGKAAVRILRDSVLRFADDDKTRTADSIE